MGNILDYLDWRGDIPFSADPFNEIDNLVLATLAYTEFDGIVPTVSQPSFISVQEANERFWSIYTHEDVEKSTTFYKYAPFLLEKLAVSRRFQELKLMNHVNHIDVSRDKQMSAVTFLPGDGTIYVAYKGTDDTLIGWKEDFNFCYTEGTAGQKEAVDYLNETQRLTSARIRVGGHSKGGNFAVYAAAFCNEDVRSRIEVVYSNDGPGFSDTLRKRPEIQAIAEKTIKYTPEFSTVGALLYNTVEPHIVSSNQTGVMQHDAFSWQVIGNHFIEAERKKGSELFDQTMRTWIDGETPENRKLFIDTFFGLFDTTGATTLSDVNTNKLQVATGVMNALRAMPKGSRDTFIQILRNLGKSMDQAVKSEIADERERFIDRIRTSLENTRLEVGKQGSTDAEPVLKDPLGN